MPRSQLKIYADWSTVNRANFKTCFPLLMPLINKSWMDDPAKPATVDWAERITAISDPSSADYFALCLDFINYTQPKLKPALDEMLALSQQYGKPVLYFTGGDFGIAPPAKNMICIRVAGYRSRLAGNSFIMPAFVPDLFENNSQKWFPREKIARPIVGFCGKSSGSLWTAFKELAIRTKHNAKHLLNLHPYDSQTIGSASYLRHKVLKQLERSPIIEDNFLIRSKYRAGNSSAVERKKSEDEFFDNIMNSHYVPCIRGGGNYSRRLFEVMACGRVPIIIDTDTPLPLEHFIPWKNHALVAKANEINRLAETIAQHYASLGNDELVALQENIRNFWLQYLTYEGYHNMLLDTLENLNN